MFDLSNARVAKLLGSKVIIVTGGGIGKPIDEVALNKALFDSEGVEIVGVILNKVLPAKHEYIEEFARRGLARLGVDLLGTIPDERLLADPELTQICESIDGEFLHAPGDVRRRVRHVDHRRDEFGARRGRVPARHAGHHARRPRGHHPGGVRASLHMPRTGEKGVGTGSRPLVGA